MTPQGRTGPGAARRAMDVAVAGTALVLLSPLLLVLCLAVRLTSPGPALFRQVRLGQHAQPFLLYKLRSMRVVTGGCELTAAGDPRVTAVGALCRSTSLDELPQLWNVLRGDMTLVGPRPETPALAAGYPPACRWVLQHRPGLTGPAQVRFRDRTALQDCGSDLEGYYLGVVVPQKVAWDADFLAGPTVRRTLAVIWETARHLAGLPVGRLAAAPTGAAAERP
ncbi:MAG: hypothetical protein JWN08_1745 [Frankiales bacterium]|nr:hypothetical protein [Frankiales bacterium]